MKDRIDNKLTSQSNLTSTRIGKSAASIVDIAKKDLREKEISLRISKNALESAYKNKNEEKKT